MIRTKKLKESNIVSKNQLLKMTYGQFVVDSMFIRYTGYTSWKEDYLVNIQSKYRRTRKTIEQGIYNHLIRTNTIFSPNVYLVSLNATTGVERLKFDRKNYIDLEIILHSVNDINITDTNILN